MSIIRKRSRVFFLEALEERLAMSAGHALRGPTAALVGSSSAAASPTAPIGQTLAILDGFTKVYLSRAGDPRYNPAYDLNHNGQIGQVDGRLLLRSLPPVSRKIPLTMTLTLAPQDKARGHLPQNSGGVTHSKTPTVLGHTSPGALIFTGLGLVDLKLRGPALVADAHGNFSFKDDLTDGINQLDFLAVDRYGQQYLRADPILWLGFGKYESAHPTKD